ncbi:DNA repair protein RecO [Paenibacillus sp. N1-5-1-14]|uniref:DNA repair protein RecO n=1 Tax=Paenibacillus radicibacter TaxID=2972488 RepID=UPI00215908C8|nr:DNA repair protein RecO [Paenibacillus radicibacter]MCR8641969.1 DNA repair protein RecO [Paenibacillus radicibacter]
MIHRVEGIILRGIDYGEGNKIITLYTKEMGKVSVMARGAKKVKSRLGAVTQLFIYGDFVFYKQGEMGTLNHGEIINSYRKLREDLYLSAYASYMTELVDRMTSAEDASGYLFEQLKAGLQALDEGKEMVVVSHLFEMKMLMLTGYSPELDACVSCGEVAPNMFFSATLGGVLCARCRNKDTRAIPITEGTWKLLRLFRDMDMRRLGNIGLKEQTIAQLKACMRAYMDTHVGIQWKARSFIEQLEKYEL